MGGGHAHRIAEETGEARRRGKACHFGDLVDAVGGGDEKLFRLIDTGDLDVMVGGNAHMLFEKTDEIEFG